MLLLLACDHCVQPRSQIGMRRRAMRAVVGDPTWPKSELLIWESLQEYIIHAEKALLECSITLLHACIHSQNGKAVQPPSMDINAMTSTLPKSTQKVVFDQLKKNDKHEEHVRQVIEVCCASVTLVARTFESWRVCSLDSSPIGV